MNKFTFLAYFIALTAILGSCKKETSNTNNNNNTNNPLTQAIGGGPTIPSGAAGALYAVSNNIYSQGRTTTINTAYAWFGSYTTTLQAGAVTCNADTLSTAIPFSNYSYPWYESQYSFLQGNMLTINGNSVSWIVGGSGSVPGFIYNDNTVFPVANFTAPSSMSANAALTVPFTITNPYDLVVCSITDGTKPQVNINVTSGNTVTFTSAQVASATTAGGETVTIQIMPIKMTSSSIGGKMYYFVKQNAFAQTTVTQ